MSLRTRLSGLAPPGGRTGLAAAALAVVATVTLLATERRPVTVQSPDQPLRFTEAPPNLASVPRRRPLMALEVPELTDHEAERALAERQAGTKAAEQLVPATKARVEDLTSKIESGPVGVEIAQ